MLSQYSNTWPFVVSPAVDGDPHFMIELPDREDALCFNIYDKPGTIFNLVREPNSGQPRVLIIMHALFFFYPLTSIGWLFLTSHVYSLETYILDPALQLNSEWLLFLQVFWSMARSLETRRFPLMEKLTPTFGVLASSTRLWVWSLWWTLRSFLSSKMANRSSCCGLTLLLSKDPSEWLLYHIKSSSGWTININYTITMINIFSSSLDLLLTKDRSLTVTLKDSVKFVILLHKVWKKHPYHRDYLGFYTLDTHLLSPSVHGLLGTTWSMQQTCNE